MFIFKSAGSGKETEKMVVQELHISTHGTTDSLFRRRNDVVVAFAVFEV